MSIPIQYPYVFFLLFIRFLAFISSAPLFSQRTFPTPAKIGLALLLAFLLAPFSPVPVMAQENLTFFTLMFQEILVGLLMGFTVLLPMLTIGVIGQLLASSMGLSYANSISPLFDDASPPLGQFYLQFALIIFISMRADTVVLLGLKRMVAVMPPGMLLTDVMRNAGALLTERLIFFTGQLWSISLQLALPVIGSILLADLALVLISRAMPRMNVFSLSLSLKLAVGSVITLIGMPFLWPQLLIEVDKAGQIMLLLFR